MRAPTVLQSSLKPPRGSSCLLSAGLPPCPTAPSRLRQPLAIHPSAPSRVFPIRCLCDPGLSTSTLSAQTHDPLVLSSNASSRMAPFQILLTSTSHPGDSHCSQVLNLGSLPAGSPHGKPSEDEDSADCSVPSTKTPTTQPRTLNPVSAQHWQGLFLQPTCTLLTIQFQAFISC